MKNIQMSDEEKQRILDAHKKLIKDNNEKRESLKQGKLIKKS